MQITKALRYRLRPTDEQVSLFVRIGGCCRKVKNIMIERRGAVYEATGKGPSTFDQIKDLPALKVELPYLKVCPADTLIQAVMDVGVAFKNFFEGRAAYPKFRKKSEGTSFRFPQPEQLEFGKDSIWLPKIGTVKMIVHRPVVGEIRNVTITSEGDEWYACILVKQEISEPVCPEGEDVGIDIGIAKPIVTSDGTELYLPKTSKKELDKLKVLHKKVSRKKNGSKNRIKAVRALGRYNKNLARRRKDAAHKATTKLAKKHRRIFLEDLHVKNMTASAAGSVEEPGKNVSQKSGLNRSMLDIAPRQVRTMFEYKTVWYGSECHAVPAQYTSQECSVCHHTCAENRKTQATFHCMKCGHEENADHNAAKNIRNKGQLKLRITGGLPGRACGSKCAGTRNQEAETAR